LFFLCFICFRIYFSVNVAVNFLWLEPDGEDLADEHACQKCGKSDHPEWILLCDKCDSGWHGSCLRPALLVIPEGDWFCPPCEHVSIHGMCIRCHRQHGMYTSTVKLDISPLVPKNVQCDVKNAECHVNTSAVM